MIIGVLALQGGVIEHSEILHKLNVKSLEVRTKKDLDNVNGLVIPGGESTTMMKLLTRNELDKEIKKRVKSGMPILGTCAGAIILAKEVIGNKQPTLGLMNISVQRNGYGRQLESFETFVHMKNKKVKGLFIRAPIIRKIRKTVESLAELDGNIVVARENNILVTTFHPELSCETKVHELFLKLLFKKNSRRAQEWMHEHTQATLTFPQLRDPKSTFFKG